MRLELIRCEVCRKEHNAQYQLPSEWITTIQKNYADNDEERHFCGRACLVKWANEQEGSHE